jgi:hypothetical protein
MGQKKKMISIWTILFWCACFILGSVIGGMVAKYRNSKDTDQ